MKPDFENLKYISMSVAIFGRCQEIVKKTNKKCFAQPFYKKQLASLVFNIYISSKHGEYDFSERDFAEVQRHS